MLCTFLMVLRFLRILPRKHSEKSITRKAITPLTEYLQFCRGPHILPFVIENLASQGNLVYVCQSGSFGDEMCILFECPALGNFGMLSQDEQEEGLPLEGYLTTNVIGRPH